MLNYKNEELYNDIFNIKYKIDNLKEIKIFGNEFVRNNKNNCSIILEGKELELCSNLNLKEINLNKNILEIKLKGIKDIKNLSHMFEGCSQLLFFYDITIFNNNNITHLCYLFKNCSKIKSLPDISKLNTSSVSNMRGLFEGCSSLILYLIFLNGISQMLLI